MRYTPRCSFVLILLTSILSAEKTQAGGIDLLAGCRAAVKAFEGVEPVGRDESMKGGFCLGLVEGMVATLIAAEALGTTSKRFPICFPADMSWEQAVRVLVKFLEAHPERLHEENVPLAGDAFADAFPCN